MSVRSGYRIAKEFHLAQVKFKFDVYSLGSLTFEHGLETYTIPVCITSSKNRHVVFVVTIGQQKRISYGCITNKASNKLNRTSCWADTDIRIRYWTITFNWIEHLYRKKISRNNFPLTNLSLKIFHCVENFIKFSCQIFIC